MQQGPAETKVVGITVVVMMLMSRARRPCNSSSCEAALWETGEWGACSVTCGKVGKGGNYGGR